MKHKQMPADGRQDHALPSVSGVFVTQMGNEGVQNFV